MSYMRITRGQWADPTAARSEAALQAVQQLFATVRGLPGNESYTGGVDASSAVTYAISVWDTEEHARTLSGDVNAIADRLGSLGLQIGQSEVVEVTAPPT
jgi:hypothetical protein